MPLHVWDRRCEGGVPLHLPLPMPATLLSLLLGAGGCFCDGVLWRGGAHRGGRTPPGGIRESRSDLVSAVENRRSRGRSTWRAMVSRFLVRCHAGHACGQHLPCMGCIPGSPSASATLWLAACSSCLNAQECARSSCFLALMLWCRREECVHSRAQQCGVHRPHANGGACTLYQPFLVSPSAVLSPMPCPFRHAEDIYCRFVGSPLECKAFEPWLVLGIPIGALLCSVLSLSLCRQ